MKFLLFIPFILIFSSCSVGSIYNPSYYSETRLGDALYRVTFQGGRAPMTGDLCLLRCAEVTLSAGKKYFQVVDSESGNSFNSFPAVNPFHDYHFNDDPFINDIPFVTKTIRISNNSSLAEFVYDAEVINSSMRRKYEIKK